MDNGLIFPYPCVSALMNPVMLSTQMVLTNPFGVRRDRLRGTDLVVVKRWGDAGR